MSDPLSQQVGGNHYKGDKIQHAEFCHANRMPYIIGNTLKYIMRHRKKNGSQDLEKATHYMQILLQLERKDSTLSDASTPFKIQAVDLIQANGIPPEEAEIIYCCCRYHLWHDTDALARAVDLTEALIRSAYPQD